MTLLCCVIIFFKFVIRLAISSRSVLLPSRLGETLAVGNGGNPFCVDRCAIVRVFSDCWASSTFALGFLVRPFGGAAGGTRGGVADTRSGVEAAIGAPALRSVGRLAAGGGLQQGCDRPPCLWWRHSVPNHIHLPLDVTYKHVYVAISLPF